MWQNMEDILRKKNYSLDEETYYQIFQLIDPQIKKWAERAQNRAYLTGIFIPKEDFISFFEEAVWNSVEFYIDSFKTNHQYELSHIIMHRLKIAEASVWRIYQNNGTVYDKNKTQYQAGRWFPIENHLKEICYNITDIEIYDQILNYRKQKPSESKIIDLLIAGYSPKEITAITFNSKEYLPKYRKRINRIRMDFKKYLA